MRLKRKKEIKEIAKMVFFAQQQKRRNEMTKLEEALINLNAVIEASVKDKSVLQFGTGENYSWSTTTGLYRIELKSWHGIMGDDKNLSLLQLLVEEGVILENWELIGKDGATDHLLFTATIKEEKGEMPKTKEELDEEEVELLNEFRRLKNLAQVK